LNDEIEKKNQLKNKDKKKQPKATLDNLPNPQSCLGYQDIPIEIN
jgi:hypothetical protein